MQECGRILAVRELRRGKEMARGSHASLDFLAERLRASEGQADKKLCISVTDERHENRELFTRKFTPIEHATCLSVKRLKSVTRNSSTSAAPEFELSHHPQCEIDSAAGSPDSNERSFQNARMGDGDNGDFCASAVDCKGSGFCKDPGDGMKRCMNQVQKNGFCQSSIDCAGGLFCKDVGRGLHVCL